MTTDWREVVNHPDIDIVAELIGGTGVAREIIEAAIAAGNKGRGARTLLPCVRDRRP